MTVELLNHTLNPDETIEKAARICYNSKSGDYLKRKKFLQGLIKSGHTATIEHASATFKISGVSRALTHELVRHRLMSFCQRSQRYCSEDGFKYVMPDTIAQHSKSDIIEDENMEKVAPSFCSMYAWYMEHIEKFYNEMVKAGIPKEDARYVLPNACCTEIIVTANFREWRHFLGLRLSPRAQWEIRNLAKEILRQLYSIAPIIFEDLYIEQFEGKEVKDVSNDKQ